MMPLSQILKPKKPRLLVIGGTGRLGPLLRRAWRVGGPLGEEAPQVIWQGRRATDFAVLGGPSVVFDPLTQPDALRAAVAASDVVLNLAGVTAGSPGALAANAGLALAALRAAEGRPVLFASSAAVYGAGRAGALCHEDDAPAPLSPYGAAKAEMEQRLTAEGVPPGSVILRIGNVAGADALLGRAAPAGGRVLDILPDGRAPRRSFIGPQALARALGRLVRLAAAGADLPGVLNVALPGAPGMDALLAAAGGTWQPRPAPAGVIPVVALDTGRAVRLGLVPDDIARAEEIVADLSALTGLRPLTEAAP